MKNLSHFGFGDTQEKFIFLEGQPDGDNAPVPENKDSNENSLDDQLQLEMDMEQRFTQMNQRFTELRKQFEGKGKKVEDVLKIMGFSSVEEFKNAKELARTSKNGGDEFEKKVQMLENVSRGFPPSFESFAQESSMEDQELAMQLLKEEIKNLEEKGDTAGADQKKAELEKTQAKCQNMILGVNANDEKNAFWARREELKFTNLDRGETKYPKLEKGGKFLEINFYNGGKAEKANCTVINNTVYEFNSSDGTLMMQESDRFRTENGKIVQKESFDPELHAERNGILNLVRKFGGNSLGSSLTIEGVTFFPSQGSDLKKGLNYTSPVGEMRLGPKGSLHFDGNQMMMADDDGNIIVSVEQLRGEIKKRIKK